MCFLCLYAHTLLEIIYRLAAESFTSHRYLDNARVYLRRSAAGESLESHFRALKQHSSVQCSSVREARANKHVCRDKCGTVGGRYFASFLFSNKSDS